MKDFIRAICGIATVIFIVSLFLFVAFTVFDVSPEYARFCLRLVIICVPFLVIRKFLYLSDEDQKK